MPSHGTAWHETLERADRWLARLLLAFAAIILLSMLLLTCADVVGRYLLNAPINGKTELTRFMMAGLIAATMPVISVTSGHISVDLLDRLFKGRTAAIRDLLVDATAALALGVLAYWLIFRADRLLTRGYVSDFLHLPLHPVAYFVAVMMAVASLALVLKLFVDTHYIRHPERRPADQNVVL
ncbi:MAG: TRAP transporter small permease [Geminicoccaceae bacterium]